ncbi:hypothetical protein J4402_04740 [Candidatus Pacearchaeota archaeon]|nr:hypothetical protein [Candidatus Pacearchaeota archaeon]
MTITFTGKVTRKGGMGGREILDFKNLVDSIQPRPFSVFSIPDGLEEELADSSFEDERDYFSFILRGIVDPQKFYHELSRHGYAVVKSKLEREK